jgi:LmbE family N-acetylglucosaminyl deacetylase
MARAQMVDCKYVGRAYVCSRLAAQRGAPISAAAQLRQSGSFNGSRAVTRLSLRSLLSRLATPGVPRSLRTLAHLSSIYDLPVSRCVPENSKVAVLAPHMDDEVLGCGGTIARHAAAGADIEVVFLTDGRHGGGGATGPGAPLLTPGEVIAIRKAEAQQATRLLGVKTLTFLDAEDTRLALDTRVAVQLRTVLERVQPEIVYVPFFLERHPDHRAANATLLEATRGTALHFECRGYEVWTPLFANCLVQIDQTIQLKEEAMRCYKSQLADNDYLHCGIGLNAYRSMGFGTPVRFVEAFFSKPLSEYLRLYEALSALT